MSDALLYSWSQARLEALRMRHDPSPRRLCARGRDRLPRLAHPLGSRMALHIFPDCGLRQGIETQSVALTVEPYRRKFLLTKHGDNPMQRNTARAPDKFEIHESIWHNFSRRDRSLGNSADWTLVRHYYIATMYCRRTRGWELTPNSPEDQALVVRSQRKAWTAELEILLRDPRVQKFTELQEKIDEADAFIMETNAKPSVNRSAPFDPYDAYDSFEFDWDLT